MSNNALHKTHYVLRLYIVRAIISVRDHYWHHGPKFNRNHSATKLRKNSWKCILLIFNGYNCCLFQCERIRQIIQSIYHNDVRLGLVYYYERSHVRSVLALSARSDTSGNNLRTSNNDYNGNSGKNARSSWLSGRSSILTYLPISAPKLICRKK